MAADIAPFRLPRYAQIPDIGLYLEQVVRYVNAYLAPLGEPELSPSMVSNYVKQRLIPAPQKKVYTAEQLARLMFIAAVKPVVPLEGLRLMFAYRRAAMLSARRMTTSATNLRICSLQPSASLPRRRGLARRARPRRTFFTTPSQPSSTRSTSTAT